MGLRRYKTIQGHPIPHVVGNIGVPWDPVLSHPPVKLEPQEPNEFPPGATVLNGFKGVQLFSCDRCGDVVAESEIPHHDCGYLAETDDED